MCQGETKSKNRQEYEKRIVNDNCNKETGIINGVLSFLSNLFICHYYSHACLNTSLLCWLVFLLLLFLWLVFLWLVFLWLLLLLLLYRERKRDDDDDDKCGSISRSNQLLLLLLLLLMLLLMILIYHKQQWWRLNYLHSGTVTGAKACIVQYGTNITCSRNSARTDIV